MNLLTAQAPGGVPRSGKGLVLGICRFMLVALALALSLGFTQVAMAQADPNREMTTAAPALPPISGVRYVAEKPVPTIVIHAPTVTTA
ncbi:hypothetical protein HSBAA_58520 [Vreelandella sulfidaeris]|uniref:Uncharacterized protein n=1 Tax=Vreelandella sulfidaeris TaxID=115553 RepID=A0A455UE40_9GAMM|nr:hypothetical protein HSBAA_58520 [Halomonas sulfidaeris]